MSYLYRHIRLDKNVPFYIGVGDDNREYKRAFDSILRNKIWKSIVSKSDYEVEILMEDLPYDFILSKESEFIKLYGKIIDGTGTLANLTDGGMGARGFIHPTESKLKRKLNYKKENHHQYGKKPSLETSQKISISNTGKKRTKECVDEIILRNKARKGTEATILRMFKIRKVRPVWQYTIDGFFIKEFASTTEAAISVFGKPAEIHSAASNKRVSSKGFKWVHKTDDPISMVIEVRGRKNEKRPVIQYSLSGEFVAEYPSIYNASIQMNCSPTGIFSVCNGHTISQSGYMWRYKNGTKAIDNIPKLILGKTSKRAVVKYTMDMMFVNEYTTISEAAKSVNGCITDIANVCKGKTKFSKKYIWRYK